MKKFILSLSLCLLTLFTLFAQEYPRGAILDEALYNSLPRKAVQVSRAYDSLPRAVSLKQYAPYPGDQGQYGTCTAWATGYTARTIAESVALERRDKALITGNVFSPVFIYKNISEDADCIKGTVISHALDIMKNPGIPKRSSTEQTIDFKAFPLSAYQQSQKFPIASYAILYQTWLEATDTISKVRAVKKSLSENKPVIIGMNTPNSFFRARSPWLPLASPNLSYGGHAMCVVGYDDDKHGGAFEIQNSWGQNWGDEGYIWIKYNDFSNFVNEAYELIEDLSAYKDASIYSGFVDIEVAGSDKGMPVCFDVSGYYRTMDSFPSGTRFRFIMGNNNPAFVYAFAADSSSKDTSRIFPSEERNESPALDYSENAVSWPGEHEWIQLDAVTGTDYLVVLYSKQEIDIDSIRGRFANTSGTFPERVARAVGVNFIDPSNIKYDNSHIQFTGSLSSKSAIMGLLLAIDHHK